MTATARTAARTLVVAFVMGLLLLGSRGTASAAPEPALSPGPEQVTVGVYVQNVQHVDLTTNSFSADFYVWLRWKDPDLDAPAGVEIMNV